MDREELQQTLTELRHDLLGLDGEAARLRDAPWLPPWERLLRRMDGLIARLEREDEPLLVVFAGGTGAGKSTLANTLAGSAVAATSARRPTTSVPTVIGRPGDLDTVLRRGVLAAEAERAALRTAPLESVPEGLVVVDAPDVDSVETANRAATERLLEVADVWVWLATARTYADEAGMVYLRQAAQLDVSTLVVLTQASDAEAHEILPDLAEKLDAAGHRTVETAHLPTAPVSGERLPESVAGPVLERIRALAPAEQRAAHRRRTVLGAVRYLPAEVDALLEAVDSERAAARGLAATVEEDYADVPQRVLTQLHEGEPLRREVLRRWTELVGSGWLQRQLHAAVGQLSPRRWLAWLPLGRGGRQVEQEAKEEARAGIAEMLHTVLEQTAAGVESAWQQEPVGRAIFAREPRPRAAGSVARRADAEALVAAWEQQVAEHVATIGRAKLSWARRATTGINATFTSAVLVLFTLSGGLSTGELALTAAGSTTTHTVLSRILGERNVHQLITDIREDLHNRVAELAESEAQVYHRLLTVAAPSPEAVDAVRARRDALAGVL
ncbi:MAG: 50S ribosome-binding GTPase [Halorhodospira halophila]|uniref:GTPase n=1 Tax=Halorhodospira TaxID=85108 RepID=UPI00191169BA|nr:MULTISPECIES: GTPase [Halorhodospira]MCC3749913.1 50S ribosome-binding GTPase [Halorhodospira halophila]MCG5527833.1 50S ribosome-binding GTPase [Halorhodospira halophila]MCG5533972.1 50S ribosome-binding GTPase [Halorhodospira sp. 9621]MCG5536996.1 50S ribosome-binding GTPase [Halorhodospira sp. 9622]MCG5542297.1 50S ribosome-binding GTPase [Halorhodospira sp. 9628]